MNQLKGFQKLITIPKAKHKLFMGEQKKIFHIGTRVTTNAFETR